MADPAAPTTSRPSRSGSKAPRTAAASTASPVSTETENKLARAARSAQRLAELSDVPADDSTLDLFPDDPTRAALEAMNIDVRQGTLTGFELPDEVLAAVEAAATEGGEAVVVETPVETVETKAARRNTRAVAKAEEAVRDDVGGAPEAIGSGVELNVALAEVRDGSDARATTSDITASPDAQPMTRASAVRNPTALRQAVSEGSAEAAGKPDASSSQVMRTLESEVKTPAAAQASPQTAAQASPQAAAPRATPELDHARATAFADTVDALYGVIADQRRAATEHSRRMKRMLSIVVGVLLVTVAIGVAQMLLLVRFTHDTTVRQQRIEETLLGQQATLATLLQTESSPAPASVAPAAAIANAGNGGNASANPDAPAAAAPRQPAEPRPSAKTPRTHKHKPAAATSTAHTH
jgi:hypothetical protein